MAKNLADLRRMPRGQLDKLRKDELIESILATNANDDGAIGRVETRLDKIFEEMAAIRHSYNVSEEANNRKMQDMKTKLDRFSEIITKQQMFLENIDRKERENHLVVLGVPEESESLDEASNDSDKLEKIWTKMGVDATRVSYRRLGRNVQVGKKRPLLVVIRSKEKRDNVLDKAKTLKDAGYLYARIYVRKINIQKSVRSGIV